MALESEAAQLQRRCQQSATTPRRSLAHSGRTCALQPCAAPPQVNECTAELKANLQEEHLAGMEFIGTVFKVGGWAAGRQD